MRKPLIVIASAALVMGMAGCGPRHENTYCVDAGQNVVDNDYCDPNESEYMPNMYYYYTTTDTFHTGQHATHGSVSHKSTAAKTTASAKPSKAQPKTTAPKATQKPSKTTKKK